MKYTKEQKAYLKTIIPGRLVSEILVMFNAKFNSDLTDRQIRCFKQHEKIPSGVVTRFFKGQVSWNKGRKGGHYSPATEFKKGHVPANERPIGSERIGKDGYVLIKVMEHKWRAKHRVVWEQANGPIPKNHVVAFKDQNKENITIDNLVLVSLQEHFIMNKKGLYRMDSKLTESGAILAKLINKTFNKKRGKYAKK